MLHLDNTTTAIYVYSGIQDLTNWTLEIERVKGREEVTEVVPLTVDYFGNSFYKLTLDTQPTLDQAEYSYKVKAGNDTIDNGILRYGAI